MNALPRGVVDFLRAAADVDPDLKEPSYVLGVYDAAIKLCGLGEGASLMDWVQAVVAMLTAVEPYDKDCGVLLAALRTFSAVVVGEGEGRWSARQLMELAELADLADICGQSNRCAPHARDLVGRFFQKSVEQGAFFRDVRMTPAHFDDLVARATPHFPFPSRGPATLPQQWRCFAV